VPLDEMELRRLDEMVDRSGGTADEAFDRHWANALLVEAATDLREMQVQAGREVAFRVFERHDLNPPPGARRTMPPSPGSSASRRPMSPTI